MTNLSAQMLELKRLRGLVRKARLMADGRSGSRVKKEHKSRTRLSVRSFLPSSLPLTQFILTQRDVSFRLELLCAGSTLVI
jgi:hypothetical protein